MTDRDIEGKVLKEIQEKYDMWADDFNLEPEDVEWLINQAKRADKNAQDLHDMDLQLASEQKQNRRYREVLSFYENRNNYRPEYYDPDAHVYMSKIDYDEGFLARRELKGDKQ